MKNIMKKRRSDLTETQCMEMIMSPAQREVFLVIDEWWKKYGHSPSLRDIAYVRGKMGLGNTQKIVNRLVLLGVIKKIDKLGRTIRPVYINFKTLE
jgi:LexA DNA binding domain